MAGRKEKHTVDYFPHYVNHKKTMHILQQKYGNDGYAFWFKLLELLGKSEYHVYDLNNTENLLYFYSEVNSTEERGKETLELLARLKAVDPDFYNSGYIYSENFCEGIKDAYRKRTENIKTRQELCTLFSISTAGNSINDVSNSQSKVKYSKVNKSKVNKSKEEENIPFKEIIEYLNETTGKQYRHQTEKTKSVIRARFNEGFTFEDFKTVIFKKTADWRGTENDLYLRPETLFGTKFEGYLNQVKPLKQEKPDMGEYIKKRLEYAERIEHEQK